MLALAWRNLWRQRRRAVVTAGAVALVVAISLLYYSVGGASKNSLYQNLTGTTGHLQVHAEGWRDTRDFGAGLLHGAADVRARLAAVAPDAEVIGALDVPALLSGEDRSRGVRLLGQDWPAAVRERFLAQAELSGRFVEAGDLDGIVLGAGLARALAVAPGDEVYAYAPGTEGFGAAAYTVVGVVDAFDPGVDARGAFLSLAAAQELAAPDAVSRLEVLLPRLRTVADDAAVDGLAAGVRAALPDLDVTTWRELEPGIVAMLDVIDPILVGVSVIFFILAGLLVVNTVYLSLMERIREFGVILSLGAAGRRVLGMITLESVLLCLVGALVGLGVGLAGVAVLARGFTVPGLQEYYASFGMNPVLYASITSGQVAFAVLFAVLTGVLAALWPAALAARLEPVEAMRFTA